jgi:hypothetical protein
VTQVHVIIELDGEEVGKFLDDSSWVSVLVHSPYFPPKILDPVAIEVKHAGITPADLGEPVPSR